MDQKRLRRRLVSIKKSYEAILNSFLNENWVPLYLMDQIDEIKNQRIIIWGIIEELDTKKPPTI